VCRVTRLQQCLNNEFVRDPATTDMLFI
jgi:hypothetical protein